MSDESKLSHEDAMETTESVVSLLTIASNIQRNDTPSPEAGRNPPLEMREICYQALLKTIAMAVAEGPSVVEKLVTALSYLRDFGNSQRDGWEQESEAWVGKMRRRRRRRRTILNLDLPSSDHCFVATMMRRRDPIDRYGDGEWRGSITIGMIWREPEKEWSFHS